MVENAIKKVTEQLERENNKAKEKIHRAMYSDGKSKN